MPTPEQIALRDDFRTRLVGRATLPLPQARDELKAFLESIGETRVIDLPVEKHDAARAWLSEFEARHA